MTISAVLSGKPHYFHVRAVRSATLGFGAGGGRCQLSSGGEREAPLKKYKDNPHSHRFIEVGTKALRRELMSGETLRAPRQQLRRLRASAFDLFRALSRARQPARLLFAQPEKPGFGTLISNG
jgi:hypothetical protein